MRSVCLELCGAEENSNWLRRGGGRRSGTPAAIGEVGRSARMVGERMGRRVSCGGLRAWQIGLVWAELLKCGDWRKRVLLGGDVTLEACEMLPSLAVKEKGSRQRAHAFWSLSRACTHAHACTHGNIHSNAR